MSLQSIFQSKLTDVDTALQAINSGDRVYLGGGAGVPLVLSKALINRAPTLRNVEITQVMTIAQAAYADPAYAGVFRVNALFVGKNVRKAVQEGRADFTPAFLSEIPAMFREGGKLPIDVALISVSPPDEHGFCSFGVEVGTTKPAAEAAKIIIAEINPHMPRTLGDSFIHISRFDYIVEVDYPLPQAPQGGDSSDHMQIGELVASIIPNGATLQMGIGSIPDAVLKNLGGHKDLGIHTELFSDGVIDLVEQGIINCAQKTFHPGKIVAGFLFGNQRLYDFVDNNPLVEMHPTDYVNDPFNIAKNDRMVAINSAIQIDLTGQVCADSIGTRIYSGVGGQIDFIRGAARSRGGVPIIAFPSTSRGGTVSRIVPTLYEGAGVVTSRSDVHYVVTEHGVVNLSGMTIRQRTKALIELADPQFRDELSAAAHKFDYL